MNTDTLEGKWSEIRGKVREKWSMLTNDDLDRIAGKRDQLIGTLQQRYGWARDRSETAVREFEDSLHATSAR